MRPQTSRSLALVFGVLLALAHRPVQAADWSPIFQGAELYGVGNWPPTATSRGGLGTTVASGDLNGDGRPDLVVTNTRSYTSGNDNTISVLLHTPNSALPALFQPKVNYAVLTGPNSVALADMNLDGNLDVVVGGAFDSVAVLLGTGTGSLGAPSGFPVRRPALGGLKIADVNHDNLPDVILARDGVSPEGISVLLGVGGGALGPAVGYSSGVPTSATPSFVATGDVTGDGNVDVVLVGTGFGVTVFQGDGLGGFTTLGTFLTFASSSQDVEIGLLNADAIPDLVVSETINPNYKDVLVLLGSGGGNFPSYAIYSLSHFPGEVSLTDFDKNGTIDIITTGVVSTDNTVTLLLGNGDGTFAFTPSYYVASPSLYRSTLADVNMDGWPDIVAPTNSSSYADRAHTVSILLANGAGGFRSSMENLQGRKPFREATADFNRDGMLDVVASDSMGVTVGLGNGDGNFFTLAKMSLGYDPGTILSADWNRDGKPDIAVMPKGTTNVVGYPGQGDGTFMPLSPLFALSGYVVYSRSAADMNRDTRPDLVVTAGVGGPLNVLTQDPGGTFTPAGAAGLTSGATQSLCTGDWNRDGNLDVAVATTNGIDVFLGTATGALASPSLVLMTGRFYADVCSGDFDRNGKLDLAGIESTAGQSGTRGIDVLLGDGFGNFAGPTSLATLEQNGYAIESWDANADGKPDLIASELTDASGSFLGVPASIEAWIGSGDGTFPSSVAHSLGLTQPANVTAPYFASGDVNRDGLPDILAPSILNFAGSNVLQTLASIVPTRGWGLGPRADYGSPQARRVAIGDLNRDGIPDVVSGASVTPGVTVRLGNANGTLGPGTTLAQSLSVSQIGLADFNRDGILDIVTSRTGLDAPDLVSCMLGVGDGSFGSRLDNATAMVLDFAIADMNRDGILDLIVGQPSLGGGFIRILLGDGFGTFAPQASSLVSGVKDLETADVNRDGILDVIVVGGDLNVVYGNGDGTLSAASLVGVPTSTLQSVCVGDIDGDGYIDLAASDLNNQILYAFGQANPPFSSFATSAVPSNGWDIQVGAAKSDGKPYLYLSTLSNELIILEQVTFGHFTPVATYPTGTDPQAIALGDLNRDGALDVVTANATSGKLSVFLHNAAMLTGVEGELAAIPRVRLSQNFPNPFNPSTTIRFDMSQRESARLRVFDIRGRLVATLVDGVLPAGPHSVGWQGRMDDGSQVGSGVYFYRLSTASGHHESRRMVVLK